MQVVSGSRVETRPVKTGLAAGALVEVREGLADGDLVVARAGTFLRDGRRACGRIRSDASGDTSDGDALMNWNISAWSIRRPVPSLVLFLVLMALGYFSFRQLPVTRFPNVDVPIVQVRVYQPGAAPSELEVQVTKKIEDAIAGVNGLKHQTSAITEGSSHHHGGVPSGGQPGPRPQRREGRHRAASAPSCRAPSRSPSSRAWRSRACRSSLMRRGRRA